MMRAVLRSLAAVAVSAVLLVTLGTSTLASGELLLPERERQVGGDDALTVLLLGSDEGPKRSQDPRRGRADGFQILTVSADRQHATLVSVPRDSWVQVPGRGPSRINACLNFGPEGCVRTVEQEFAIDVDHYLLTSMQGFAEAVAAFGGLTVDVDRTLTNGGTAISPGEGQRLSGSQALTYARDRKNRPGGDPARSQAQAELLALAHEQVTEQGDLAAVVEAAEILRRHTVTDLAGPQLVRLAFEAMRLPPSNVDRRVLPASIGRAGAASVMRLQPGAHDLVRDAAADGRVG